MQMGQMGQMGNPFLPLSEGLWSCTAVRAAYGHELLKFLECFLMKKKKAKSKTANLRPETRNYLNLMGSPVWKAFAREDQVSKTAQISIGLSGRKALYALTNGQGAFEHLKELLVTAHAGMYLAEQGYGADLADDFQSALRALLSCLTRAKEGEAFALDELEAAAVSELLGLHEQQIELADRALLSAAIVESYRRMASALA